MVPPTTAMLITAAVIPTSVCVAARVREKTSAPTESVPKRWPQLGGARNVPVAGCSGG